MNDSVNIEHSDWHSLSQFPIFLLSAMLWRPVTADSSLFGAFSF